MTLWKFQIGQTVTILGEAETYLSGIDKPGFFGPKNRGLVVSRGSFRGSPSYFVIPVSQKLCAIVNGCLHKSPTGILYTPIRGRCEYLCYVVLLESELGDCANE